jgi:quaternary ammonium compound-resistance protein SugE
MAWIMLFVAGVFEVVWAYAMKQSLVTMVASFLLLSAAMRSIPLGTAYTIWTGIGAVGAFIVGVTLLGEQLSLMRVVAAVLIVSGLVLMKMSAGE